MTTYRSAWMALGLCASALACPCLAAPASSERTQAQPSEPPSTPADEAVTELSPVVVESSATTIPLDLPTGVASPLGLSVRETPNAVEVLTQERLQREGARTLIEAYCSAAGISAGNLPGEPGVTSLRGFSRGETGYLIDGMRTIDPLLVSRNYDTWNFERIEVLKGPASVAKGVGALAGAINLVTKKPSFESPSQEALFSYGSFGSWQAAVGGNRPLSDQVAVRADAVLAQSAGYVHDTTSRTGALTTGLGFKASERLTLMAPDADGNGRLFLRPFLHALPGNTPVAARERARALGHRVGTR